MSECAELELGWVTVVGSPREVGRALGEAGRKAVHDLLLQEEYWQVVTDLDHTPAVQRMAANVRTYFPAIWEEIQGLAEGLQVPLESVLAWNCRGDLLTNVPDGCTTVQLPGQHPVIGHNEDGLVNFRGHAFVADIRCNTGPGFMSFCYPGSLPGHTIAATDAGLVQAVNNLRLRGVVPDIPRMVLGRAVLACESLDEAMQLLTTHNGSGGFHLTLAQVADRRLLSVEFGGGNCVIQEVDRPEVHANHALQLPIKPSEQLITASSHDRQMHGTQLLSDGAIDPLALLRDTQGPGLPIHRTAPDDPDCENTLATAVFNVGSSGVDWRIYDQNSEEPVFEGRRLRR